MAEGADARCLELPRADADDDDLFRDGHAT